MELARLTLELHVSDRLSDKKQEKALAVLDDEETLAELRRAVERGIRKLRAMGPVTVILRD